ncbi:MAG: hypothetical protein AB7S39_05855 [Gemmatimonadales bacterium]
MSSLLALGAVLGALAGQPANPAEHLAAVSRTFLATASADWDGLDRLPGIQWAALPPASLRNCLPNGDCFARQGTAAIGATRLAIVASGARTIVAHLLIRATGTLPGGSAVIAALGAAGLETELARCPVTAGPGTSWYRVRGEGVLGTIAIQPAAAGRATEGYILTRGEELPALEPNQLASYTEQCAEGAPRKAVATKAPHLQLAEVMVRLLEPAGAGAGLDWSRLETQVPDITWSGSGPMTMDLTVQNDPSPMARSGAIEFAGRKFSVLAAGTADRVRNIYFDEQGLHPRGEHLLGVVYELGIAVRLVRCGPVYTESTNNWYALTSNRTRPATIRQSIRYDGQRVQDSYALRLDGSLPGRDPRDRDPGVGGCR